MSPGQRVAVVTGAARGIGQAIALRLAETGHALALADVRPADATVAAIRNMRANADGDTIRDAGGAARTGATSAVRGNTDRDAIEDGGAEAFAVSCDLGSPEGVDLLVREVTGRCGGCDVLVNCAGLMLFRLFGELDLATWRRVQAVNVEAAFQLCAAFVPGMAERGFGRVISVASNTVWKPPGPGFAAYIASKGAIVGFTRALAVELGASGITVNAIAPGLTRSPGAEEGNPPEHFEDVRQAQAVKRSVLPADLAGAVAFLASDDAAMITGQTIRIDGGLVTL